MGGRWTIFEASSLEDRRLVTGVTCDSRHRNRPRNVVDSLRMPVTVEMHNTGNAEAQRDAVARIEHVLSDRPGDWRVIILGSQADDRWEMRITGPNAFERSYTLEGDLGQHEPAAVAAIVARMLPNRS